MIVLALVLIFIAIMGLRSDLQRIAAALERVGRIDRCVQNIKDAGGIYEATYSKKKEPKDQI